MPSPKNPSLTLLIRRAEKRIAKLRCGMDSAVIDGPAAYADAKSELAIAERCLADLKVERFRRALGERPNLETSIYRGALNRR